MAHQFISESVSKKIKHFLFEKLPTEPPVQTTVPHPLWNAFNHLGTELWLDTGDIEASFALWSSQLKALTTNNTLLNREIQKGIYDDLIQEANQLLKELPLKTRILEIAFILNAFHGLRLVELFKGLVSVELHTDLAHDYEGILHYGRRLHEVCPDHFLIKVPFTSTGLLGARALGEMEVPVNCTLEFSARQNVMVALVAKPAYQNVFLGRIGSYLRDNELGTGEFAGEKTTIASQQWIRRVTADYPNPPRLIAASLRNSFQMEHLAGIDVFTMPPKIALEALARLSNSFVTINKQKFLITTEPNYPEEKLRLGTLWNVTDQELALAHYLDENLPADGEELEELAHRLGCKDLFPRWQGDDLKVIAADGKIPLHKRWNERIAKGELAIDTLLNKAGLASFTKDQAALDERISGLIH